MKFANHDIEPRSIRRLLWSGYLVLMELDGNNNVLRKYTWGLDVAGLSGGVGSPRGGASAMWSAAGVGGLVAMEDLDPQTELWSGGFLYLYDGNGNVGQVVTNGGSVTAVSDQCRTFALYWYLEAGPQ